MPKSSRLGMPSAVTRMWLGFSGLNGFFYRGHPKLAPGARKETAVLSKEILYQIPERKPSYSGFGMVSQSFTVWSSLPDANRCPSGEKATEETTLVWPFRVATSCRVATSQ